MSTVVENVRYEPTRLVVPKHFGEEEFADLFAALGGMARGHQWWIGDALVAAERALGEEYAQIAEALGLEPHTLTNYRWVADSVVPSRRREDLSFSHHAEVARLTNDQQRAALARAAKEEWTVRQLRDYVAIEWPQGNPSLFDERRDSLRDDVEANRRLERIERVLDAGDAVEESDVRWLVDVARQVIRS